MTISILKFHFRNINRNINLIYNKQKIVTTKKNDDSTQSKTSKSNSGENSEICEIFCVFRSDLDCPV